MVHFFFLFFQIQLKLNNSLIFQINNYINLFQILKEKNHKADIFQNDASQNKKSHQNKTIEMQSQTNWFRLFSKTKIISITYPLCHSKVADRWYISSKNKYLTIQWNHKKTVIQCILIIKCKQAFVILKKTHPFQNRYWNTQWKTAAKKQREIIFKCKHLIKAFFSIKS